MLYTAVKMLLHTYQIAGRISLLDQHSLDGMEAEGSTLLPIDSLFVDEVQDFTQAELYILAKLCRDPNSLFLAGDTAQSIAVGVDFRFTDVRQIFYNSFGGIEPELLQLSHNYRSHAGVLRLAACVVELLYHVSRILSSHRSSDHPPEHEFSYAFVLCSILPSFDVIYPHHPLQCCWTVFWQLPR